MDGGGVIQLWCLERVSERGPDHLCQRKDGSIATYGTLAEMQTLADSENRFAAFFKWAVRFRAVPVPAGAVLAERP
jgi:hypothetical protein